MHAHAHACVRSRWVAPGQELRRRRSVESTCGECGEVATVFFLCIACRHDYSHQFLIHRHASSSSSSSCVYGLATCVILSNPVDVHNGDKPMGSLARRNHAMGHHACCRCLHASIRPPQRAAAAWLAAAAGRSTCCLCPYDGWPWPMAIMMVACPCRWAMRDGWMDGWMEEWRCCCRRMRTQSWVFVRIVPGAGRPGVPFTAKATPPVFYKCAKCESCMR